MHASVNESRRRLLKAGLLAAVAAPLAPRLVLRAAAAQTPRDAVLVAIFLRGAVDGLSMVVPHGEARYYDARRTIAIPRPRASGGALDLDGFFGLHPAASALLPAWRAGELAIVHACGSPDPTRSHFDAQDDMETGVPGDRTAPDGWLNRHLQSAPRASASTVRAVALTTRMPRSLGGPAPALATATLADAFGPAGQGDLARGAVERMYGERADLLSRATRDALASLDVFARLDATAGPANGAVYPDSDLGRQLRDVARVVKAKVGLEIAVLDKGGWDTHSVQGGSEGQLAGLLRDLAASLAAFRIDLGHDLERVCVLAMSEFGRTLDENGSGGTDHGHATAMLVLGGPVAGGHVFGRWPGLARGQLFEGRDLAVTTDFRTLFAELVVEHLGNPNVAAVFPGFAYGPSTRLRVVA